MSFSPKQIITIIILFICIMLGGCGDSLSSGSLTGQSRPSYCVTIEELASRLGLTVRQAGNPYYELSNANNTVKVFTYDGGRVYVNGTAVGSVGLVQRVGGKQYIPELLVPKIRSSLIANTPIQPWTPPSYTPTPRSGSGIVVIDPGHGGKDPGAQSVLGYWEKGINLKIAKKAEALLRDAGVTVHMTRESDVYPALEDRAVLANRVSADLFVSIHCDSNGNRVHKGFTVYVARSAGSGSKKAGRILENKLSDEGIPSKGMRKGNYRVLVQTKCPAVLVECGYMSNYDEAALLMAPWYQNKLAQAIADGILEYL